MGFMKKSTYLDDVLLDTLNSSLKLLVLVYKPVTNDKIFSYHVLLGSQIQNFVISLGLQINIWSLDSVSSAISTPFKIFHMSILVITHLSVPSLKGHHCHFSQHPHGFHSS